LSERLTHQRSKGPVSTPAQRLVEIQQELARAESREELLRLRIVELERDYDRYHRMSDTSFGGIPMAQIRADMVLWEAVLNENPQLKAIFEIGTWQGGLSWWLWAQTEARGLYFRTYDAIQPARMPPKFIRTDVFADSEHLGEKFRSYEPCVVFCDGGNKPRELKLFAGELRHPESLLFVHDWGTEFFPENVPASVRMVYGDFCEELGSITRVFQLKENDE
jgi:hypothetical protein